MLKGRSWLWYAGVLGLLIAALIAPFDLVRPYLLPAAWLWPILIWSAMGTREKLFHTDQIMFSIAHPLRRQLPAIWLVGFIVAIVTGAGVAVRFLLQGQWENLFAWGVGAAFIPSLALALGTWSSSKLFEVVYVLWWYFAFKERIAALDFMGLTDGAIEKGIPLIYGVLVVILWGLATIGRRRQIHR